MRGIVPALSLRARARKDLLHVVVGQHALGDLLHGHGQVVLRARFHKRRRVVVEGALAELVVVIVDMPRPLGRNGDERIARIDVEEQIIYERLTNRGARVPAEASRTRTSTVSCSNARS